jgi:hypothetical protein
VACRTLRSRHEQHLCPRRQVEALDDVLGAARGRRSGGGERDHLLGGELGQGGFAWRSMQILALLNAEIWAAARMTSTHSRMPVAGCLAR